MSESTTETRMETIRKELRKVIVHMTYENLSLRQCQKIIQQVIVEKALSDARGNQCKAAGYLGIHRNTLRRAMNFLAVEFKGRKNAVRSSRQALVTTTNFPEPVLPEHPVDRMRLRMLEKESYPLLSAVEFECRMRLAGGESSD